MPDSDVPPPQQMTRTLKILLLSALIGVSLLTGLTMPASAELKSVTVRMDDGTLQEIVLDVDRDATLKDIEELVPGQPIFMKPVEPKPGVKLDPGVAGPGLSEDRDLGSPSTDPQGAESPESLLDGSEKPGKTDESKPLRFEKKGKSKAAIEAEIRRKARAEAEPKAKPAPTRAEMRNSDGSPSRSNPGLVATLPGPSSYEAGVPNFMIRKFRVPPFLLPIYQAAGIQYGVRWEVLAAINEIETDYGRNLNVSSAGALGWMQFMPATWRMYGTDANKDGKKDPYNPVDAIFASARYLKAAGYEDDPRAAVFAYNHADWYVDSVLLRARLISGVPADLIGSLTGLTEGRFPVAAKARYADDLKEQRSAKRVKVGDNAANVIESDDDRNKVEIYSEKGAPVVATNDGVIKKVGRDKKLGRYVILQDVYGNRYTYAGLGSASRYVAVARQDARSDKKAARALAANAPADRKPAAPASKGVQPEAEKADATAKDPKAKKVKRARPAKAPVPVKQRLFAHPDMPDSREAGGLDQLLEGQGGKHSLSRYEGNYAKPIELDRKRFKLTRMKVGARVIGGTVLGRVGKPDAEKGAHLSFSIRPAGKGAPQIDPKPILDGWKLLEATSIYRASGRNALQGSGASIGQILLMPKAQLERRVLADERIEVYDGGRGDIRAGQIDRRVLATLSYLAESGLRPTVTSLKNGHGYFTASGNVSEHSAGSAVDIAAINGVSIVGHQDRGGITEQTVRRLMRLQGTMAPHQIISLLDLGGATMAMGDHDDHIHVGFRPRYGDNRKLGRQAEAVLKPGQWPELLKRLDQIENPVVPTKASPYAIPAKKRLQKLDDID